MARNICTFKGCGRIVFAYGLCAGHNAQKHKHQRLKPLRIVHRSIGTYPKGTKCSFRGCDSPAKVHGMCSTHYSQWRCGRKLTKIRHTHHWNNAVCRFKNCSKPTAYGCQGYCRSHHGKLHRYGDPSISRDIRGSRNPRWNGGTSEYTNHYTMKVVRKERIGLTGGRCECCGCKPKSHSLLHAHHVDLDKSNHDRRNIVILCPTCHKLIHKQNITKRSLIIRYLMKRPVFRRNKG